MPYFETCWPSNIWMDATTTVLWLVPESPQGEVKQNDGENKWMGRKNLWIKPHIRLIKFKFNFSGAHFDDKFAIYGVASCIMLPTPFVRELSLKSY